MSSETGSSSEEQIQRADSVHCQPSALQTLDGGRNASFRPNLDIAGMADGSKIIPSVRVDTEEAGREELGSDRSTTLVRIVPLGSDRSTTLVRSELGRGRSMPGGDSTGVHSEEI
eukprot:CAMPEP_0196655420 /NCGR_PEP_ID=MMETSP1086-20130531/5178_1 /TAXON_ID=77921 /ORGANISM="Cyanoptyche  gloeocystis , Strain SAG4.97" /LENGTH=114 /DNA_ID=CAMNT_0041987725 /DNA_START=1097 /DNA_END=1444 /DNA_ORIENTATION=-